MSTTASRQYNWVNDKDASIPITASRMDTEFNAIITKLNQKAIISSSAPSGPIEGMLWYDSTNKVLKQFRNSEWVIYAALHVGTSAPSTAQDGDLFYNTTNNSLQAYNGTAWEYMSTPPGAIQMWTTDTAPSGWLLCYGQAVSRTTYAALFSVIGETFGVGDGETTFNLPDLRGRFPLGQDDMGGSSANRVTDSDADTLGGTDGDETKTLTTDNLPPHSHQVYQGGAADNTNDYYVEPPYGTSNRGAAGGATTETGSGTAFDIMPPFITLNFIIKT